MLVGPVGDSVGQRGVEKTAEERSADLERIDRPRRYIRVQWHGEIDRAGAKGQLKRSQRHNGDRTGQGQILKRMCVALRLV